MPQGLLSGFTVIEIAHPLTEYAGLVLAGLGAGVLLVEPPEGAATRRRNPRVPGSGDSPRGSIPFLARNTNKQSVVIDPASPAGVALLHDLLARADAVLDAEGSAFHQLVAASTATATVTVTDRRGLGTSSIVGFAASGGLSSSGWPHQPPCNAPSWLALDGAGIYAATMALAAAVARRRGAPAAHYQIPYEEAIIAAITPWTRPLHSYGMTVAGQGAASARLGAGPHPIYEARDGYVRVLTSTPRQWQAWLDLIGRPEELVSGPWSEPRFRAQNFDAVFLFCSELTKTRTVADLFHEGQRLGLTITPVYTIEQFLADRHVQAREVMQAIDDPEFGPMQLMRPPCRIDPEELNVPVRPAPGLGQHMEEARALAAEPLPPPPPPGADVDLTRPLAGLRVLEFGVGAVVPESASFLALLGAEVLKIESIVHVDMLRQYGLNGYGDVNNCPTFNQLNLGVQSVAVDMSTAEGVALVRRLAGSCDIIMENLRGPVTVRWGFEGGAACRQRPELIYFSSQGLGRGPYGDFQTYGPNLQTFSGVTSQWAHPDDPYPVGTTLNHPDHVAGKQGLVPLLAALLRRDASGEGCFLECAQFEVPASMIGDRFLEQHVFGAAPLPLGNRSRDMAPHGCYPCAEDDRWCAIAVEDDSQWQRLRALVGDPWMRAADLATTEGRLARAAEIDANLAAWTGARPLAEVEALLYGAGIPTSRVCNGDDFAANEAAHASGIFAAVAHPTAGLRVYTGAPVLTSAGARPPTRRPPLLGEHTEHALFDILRLPAHEADALMAQQAVGH